MIYKKSFSLMAVMLLITSYQNHAMNFDNKKLGLFGAFLGGIAVCRVGQYIWESIRPRISSSQTGNVEVVAAATTKIPDFNEVNKLVKLLGVNAFIGFYIQHEAPVEGQLWKDCFKQAIAFDATNGLVNRTHKPIPSIYNFVTQNGNDFEISTGISSGPKITFNPVTNLARLNNAIIRTYQGPKDL